MKKTVFGIAMTVIALASSCTDRVKDGEYTIELLTTNDLHGCYFDSSYVSSGLKPSLIAVNYYVDSVRTAAGRENVVLIDAGDVLQGDNAAYYFNYIDSCGSHVWPRMASYMGYDAAVCGNHDIETGHRIYDRINRELKSQGIPFLAGNAIKNNDGGRYFPEYTLIHKNGIKILVLGYTNANTSGWLDESIWSGMHFESLLPLVQQDVDALIEKKKPHIVVVAVHSGTGEGDGSALENQGLDLLNSLNGVDFVVCAHDHRATTVQKGGSCLINSGSHARNIGHGTVRMTVNGGKIVKKEVSAGLIKVKKEKADSSMRATFQSDFEKVKAFTVQEVGELSMELRTKDAFRGMSDYVNFVHSVQIGCQPAQISFAAPLKYNGYVRGGVVLFNDLFTVYPYENQLYVLKMKGSEIKDYLENSYDMWIQTIKSSKDHILNIKAEDDSRNGQQGWSFVHRSYNFDSAAGVNYSVDVTKPFGERIVFTTMAGGEPFDITEEYNVAMTSYRASGGGGLLLKAGIDSSEAEKRIILKSKEIRDMVYDFFMEHGTVSHELISDPSVIGEWKFVPQDMASKAMDADMSLLFGE